jgi:hypothetical protein
MMDTYTKFFPTHLAQFNVVIPYHTDNMQLKLQSFPCGTGVALLIVAMK